MRAGLKGEAGSERISLPELRTSCALFNFWSKANIICELRFIIPKQLRRSMLKLGEFR